MGKRKSPSDNESSLTPYTIFVKRAWEKTDKKGDYGSFVKTCEVKWGEMTETEKKIYELPDKEKSIQEETNPRKKARKVNLKDPNKKKKPRGPYIIFSTEMRDTVRKSKPDLSMTQISQELGKMWKALSESEKQKYHEMANKEKEKYLRELKEEENTEK